MSADSSPRSIAAIRSFLLSWMADSLGVASDAVDEHAPLHRYGLDSTGSAALVAAVSEFLGRAVPILSVWDHPTLATLSEFLARGPRGQDFRSGATARTCTARAGQPMEPLAVVGIGCRLPGAPDPTAFWRLLINEHDAVRAAPAARRGTVRWGGFLDDIDLFDPLFFGISPREAKAMDPQQRLVLELAWEALEDAGIAPGGLTGTNTGVYLGASWSDYAAMAHRLGAHSRIGPHTATGTHNSIIANRVSYALGLEGPSITIDTACSSSLVAVHLACQAIRLGEAELALAGGVDLNFCADHDHAMDELGALSPDGRCKTFDARADGYVRSEGAAIVALAPLRVALARDLPVYCLIRGSAINNDGASNGLTAPNPRAQEAVLRAAYRNAGLSPALVDYVECHGTGTPLGDPIEARAIGNVLGQGRGPGEAVRIGSVKTNIGHLEPAAGIAGLVKVALALRNGVLPASLHYSQANPQIALAEANLEVQDRTTAWARRSDARRAGISAFGFGGTNCHVVTEELPHPEGALLLFAEDSAAALARRVDAVRAALEPDRRAELAPLARETLRVCGTGPFRFAAAARDLAELRTQLDAFAVGQDCPGSNTSHHVLGRPRIAFLCSGTGSQWLGMGRRLLAGMPKFRRSLLRGDERMRALLGFSVVDRLITPGEEAWLDDMRVVQPLLFCVQIALADTWRSVGVEPDVVLGHSIGEFAAAYLSGALDFDDASLLAATHADLIQRVAVGHGDSIVVGAAADALEPYLGTAGERIGLAGYNSPTSTLVSGATVELDELRQRLTADAITNHRVRMGYAAHSPMVDPVLEPLRTALERIIPRRSRVPMVSTVTGEHLADYALGPDYWVRNVGQASDLASAVRTMADLEVDIVIELSPHPIALEPVREILSGGRIHSLATLQRGVDDGWSLRCALGHLHAAGYPIRQSSFFSGCDGRHVTARRSSVFPDATNEYEQGEPPYLIPITAHSESALAETCRELSNHVEREPNLWVPDLAYTLTTRRTPKSHRITLLARDRRDILAGLARATGGEAHPDVSRGVAPSGHSRRVVFVFAGSGTQWPGMGRELLDRSAGFREHLRACDAAVHAVAGWSVLAELTAPPERSRLDEVAIQQPVLFALQLALARLWGDLGVTPVAVIGHSLGEVAAACVAGALSLEDAARVVVARSHLLQHKADTGAMIAVELPEDRLVPHLARFGGRVAVAALNSPTSATISGPAEDIQALAAELRRAGTTARLVNTDRAFHSAAMDPLLPALRAALTDIKALSFTTAFHSTALDGAVNPRVDADYWVHNLRDQVCFAPAVTALLGQGVDTFLELGPHGTLRGNIEETAVAQGLSVYVGNSLQRGQSDVHTLLRTAAALFVHGVPLTLEALFPDGGQVVETPLVRWQKDRYWLDTPPRSAPSEHTEKPSPSDHIPTDAAAAADILRTEIAAVLGVSVGTLNAETRLRDLGLDSMLAMRLSNRMQAISGRRISPAEFLDDRTFAELLRRLRDRMDRPAGSSDDAVRAGDPLAILDELSEADAEDLLNELLARELIDPDDDAPSALEELRTAAAQTRSFHLAPASHGQTGIWIMQQLALEGVPYNFMFTARVPARLDEQRLCHAIRAVVQRHPALRTVFVEAAGQPLQLILDEPRFEFHWIDAPGIDDETVRDTLAEYGHRPLDLDGGPILRIVLLSSSPQDNYLLLVVHHIAADATSLDVLVHDIQKCYAQSEHGPLPAQRPLAPYTRFVEWERRWLAGPEAESALRWWTKHLADPPPHIELPHPAEVSGPRRAARSIGVTYAGADLTFRWSTEETRLLTTFAAREGFSISTVTLAGFFATLNRITEVEDMLIATAVAQRAEPGFEAAVGYYLNTVLIRAKPAGHRTFHELLREVHEFSQGMLTHMNYPLDLLTNTLQPPRVDGRLPWFDFAVNWLSSDAFDHTVKLFHGVGELIHPPGGLPLVPMPVQRRFAKFDLEISMGDVAGEVVGHAQYKPSFLERETVMTLLEHYRTVLFSALRRPDLALAHAVPDRTTAASTRATR
ncbi:acyltransferase domain-containing protein [Nocardia sp. CA-107356]|uniref:acyltransferase domain-containing protein n=1 Tax=Nocardia sp. CA-107356 TaxID=3239972 RepID=UPI003D91B54A